MALLVKTKELRRITKDIFSNFQNEQRNNTKIKRLTKRRV